MTIEVSIMNKDAHRTVVIEAVEYDKVRGRSETHTLFELAPGTSGTWAVHLLRDIQISEKKP